MVNSNYDLMGFYFSQLFDQVLYSSRNFLTFVFGGLYPDTSNMFLYLFLPLILHVPRFQCSVLDLVLVVISGVYL